VAEVVKVFSFLLCIIHPQSTALKFLKGICKKTKCFLVRKRKGQDKH
jgi:hypothetical protein